MKKIFSLMAVAALAVGFTACEDIPAPYAINDKAEENANEEIYYESSACYTGWNLEFGSTQTIQYNPWSQGSSYTQATGYQKWDGAADKSNKEAEGYLVSPKFKTTAKDNNVVFSFDYCIGYAQNDKDFAKHTKLYVSKTYTEGSIDLSEWEQIDWVPTHTSTDWTLANTTNIALPAAYQNQPNVHLAFWFYAPAGGSATFEIMNFTIETGETQYTGGNDTPVVPDTPTGAEPKGSGTQADPFNVAGVIKYTSSLAADVNSDKEVYFTGIVKKFKSGEEPGNSYGNATFYIKDEEGDADFYCFRVLGKDGKKFTEGAEAPAVGDVVTVRGLVVNYKGNTPETVSGKAYVESIVKGEGSTETPDEPTIGGSAENGDFESWNGDTPLYWTTASTAGNASLKKSTDAHSGNYSVEVGGTSGSNKRLGRAEMTLEAGTYTMTFWAKAATSTGGSVRPGYVPVNNGSVGTYVYAEEYVNGLTTDAWTQVTYTFDIAETGTYSVVIMNSKNPGANVLIDDFVLMKGDAKIIGSARR